VKTELVVVPYVLGHAGVGMGAGPAAPASTSRDGVERSAGADLGRTPTVADVSVVSGFEDAFARPAHHHLTGHR
jgi:hypothetical protein